MKKKSVIKEILDRVEVEAKTICLPSEDLDKVKRALQNVLTGEIDIQKTVNEEIYTLRVKGSGFKGLQKIYHGFRNRHILAVVRRHLKSKTRKGKIIFSLNKQAAYVGTISIAEEGESDLGAIDVTISSPNPSELIVWMTKF